MSRRTGKASETSIVLLTASRSLTERTAVASFMIIHAYISIYTAIPKV